MGIFSWIKNLFRKSINADGMGDNTLVLLSKSGNVKLGTTLEVKSNFVAVLCHHNKVFDSFVEGRYRLDTKQIPLLSRDEKLTRQNKKGDLPKNFNADIYYINLKIFENEVFSSFDSVVVKTKNYKKVNVKLSGEYSFQIINPVDFLEALFTQFGIVKDGIAKDEISDWISKSVIKKVQKNNPQIDELYERNTKCFEGVVEYANKTIFDCGIKVQKIDITDVRFPKKIYKNVSLSYEELHQKPVSQYSGETTSFPNPVEKAKNVEFENESNEIYKDESQKIENELSAKVLEIDSNGKAELHSGQIENKNNEVLESEKLANINVYSNTVIQDGEIKSVDSHDTANDKELVKNETLKVFDEPVENKNDENDEEKTNGEKIEQVVPPVQKFIEYKKCGNCGALNPKDSEFCFSCKAKFSK